MKLSLSHAFHSPICIAVLTTKLLLCTEAFTISTKASFGLLQKAGSSHHSHGELKPTLVHHKYVTEESESALFAKKKKGKVPVAANMDFDLFDDDEPMSKKDQMKAQKKAAKEAKKNAHQQNNEQAGAGNAKAAALAALEALDDDDEPMSAKEKAQLEKKKAKEAKKAAQEEPVPDGKKDRKAAALKALEEMERMEAQMAADTMNGGEESAPKLSKKEAKAAAKKAAKEEAKKAAKEAKKAAKRQAAGDDTQGEPDLEIPNGDVVANGETAVSILCLTVLS